MQQRLRSSTLHGGLLLPRRVHRARGPLPTRLGASPKTVRGYEWTRRVNRLRGICPCECSADTVPENHGERARRSSVAATNAVGGAAVDGGSSGLIERDRHLAADARRVAIVVADDCEHRVDAP